MWPMPSCSQRPADLGELGLGDLPAGLGRVEVVAAAIGVELDEQPVPLDHLGQAAKRRRRALLVDQEGRVDRRGRVVERDHQVERRLPGQPGMGRAVLVQHHARPSAGAAASAVRTTLGRRRDRAALLQPQPGRRVAQRVAVPAAQRVVEVPDREAGIVLVVEPQHPLQLVLRRPPRRRLAHPPVDQPRCPVLRVAPAPAAEGPLAHPQRRCRLDVAQRPGLPAPQQLLKAHHPDPRAHPRPALPPQPSGTVLEPDRSRAPYAGQLARSLQAWLLAGLTARDRGSTLRSSMTAALRVLVFPLAGSRAERSGGGPPALRGVLLAASVPGLQLERPGRHPHGAGREPAPQDRAGALQLERCARKVQGPAAAPAVSPGDDAVAGEQRQLLDPRLGDQHAIERILVEPRQRCVGGAMGWLERQQAEPLRHVEELRVVRQPGEVLQRGAISHKETMLT